jgi:glycosyltransferase involved in cell wall biosynthesis
MKIGIVCQNFPPAISEGGISHYSALLSEHLVKRGHRVFAVTSTEFSRPEKGDLNRDNPQIVMVKGPWGHCSVLAIKRLAINLGLDAVILQYSPASFNFAFRFIWAITPFPCQKVTALHTLWGGGWYERVMGFLLLMGSNKIMAILERRLRHFLTKTCWIPIGSNILPEKDQGEDHFSDMPLIIFFGMIYPGKGLDMILDVLETLKKRQRRFAFKFIGGVSVDSDGYERAFRNRIREKNLGDMAEHIGLIPAAEVSSWLKKTRFVFLPYEGGLSDRRGSLMAAIIHGKAILTSPPAVPVQYLKNGINVLWPEAPSVDDYSSFIERLLSDDGLLNRLEKGAVELAPNFTWDRIAAEYELLLSMMS